MNNSTKLRLAFAALMLMLFSFTGVNAQSNNGNANGWGNGNGNGATPTSNGVVLPSGNNGQGFDNGQGHLNGNSNVNNCLANFPNMAWDKFTQSLGNPPQCIEWRSPTRVWMAAYVLGWCDIDGYALEMEYELVDCEAKEMAGGLIDIPIVPCGATDHCGILASFGITP